MRKQQYNISHIEGEKAGSRHLRIISEKKISLANSVGAYHERNRAKRRAFNRIIFVASIAKFA